MCTWCSSVSAAPQGAFVDIPKISHSDISGIIKNKKQEQKNGAGLQFDTVFFDCRKFCCVLFSIARHAAIDAAGSNGGDQYRSKARLKKAIAAIAVITMPA